MLAFRAHFPEFCLGRGLLLERLDFFKSTNDSHLLLDFLLLASNVPKDGLFEGASVSSQNWHIF